ncbi:MAG TPA: alpha-amylase family glycosyl hydrolase [Candidatus Saccharimonadales bacterium]|nr:alpha-amylase family glycosyl hydrolase [Candidatus Saccharimonadales bacterium]
MILKSKNWFEGAVAYQIYPRSFYDSDGDGVGDLRGIIEKLDYLAGRPDSLGVDVIWLCPFYKSPMADFGYDIADYYSIDPVFGNLDDARDLIVECHKRDIKILVDLVANHTSDEHPWFIDSKTSTESSKREWYIWRDGHGTEPPNDWLSVFGGSAWQYDKTSGQYYLHSFSTKQPDLNWANPDVRKAVKDIMRFWLDLGVDGFRADAVYWLAKDHRYRNDPLKSDAPRPGEPEYDELVHTYSRNGHQLYEYLRQMAGVLDDYKDKFMIVEAYPEGGKQAEEYLKFYKYVDPEHLSPFIFEGIYLPWEATAFGSFINQFQAGVKKNYLPVYVMGNHDQSRLASRIGTPAARAAGVLQLTLPGMPFIYYGEELSMKDSYIPARLRNDPLSLHGDDRDKSRTPMQWNGSEHAGFSRAKPWLPPANDYKNRNVSVQRRDRDSSLSLYRELIKLRKNSKALSLGKYVPLEIDNIGVFGFKRRYRRREMLVLVNFTAKSVSARSRYIKGKVRLSTHLPVVKAELSGEIILKPNEAVIIESSL